MSFILESINDLLSLSELAPEGVALRQQLREAFATYQIECAVLADEQGAVLATDAVNGEFSRSTIAQLATESAGWLKEKQCELFTTSVLGGLRNALAIRLAVGGGKMLFGSVFTKAFSPEAMSCEMGRCEIFAASLAYALLFLGEEQWKMRVRMRQLQAEHDSLRASHAEAVNAAIGEREERLREHEEHVQLLQAVMMMAAEGIVTVDENGTIESFNEAAGRIFGYSPEEVLGRGIAELIPTDGGANAFQHAVGMRPENVVFSSGASREVTGVRKDGLAFPLELAVSEVYVGDRCVFTGILRDITERRRLEAQLRQAQKLESIGQLAAGIAHEINTPTQYIGDNARFLQDAFDDIASVLSDCIQLSECYRCGGDVNEIVRHIVDGVVHSDAEYLVVEVPKAIQQSIDGVHRVAKIVRSMKEFSHPGGDKFQACDLNQAIESTLTVSRNEWKYVADVETDFDPNLPLVTCLPSDVNQMFLNLIVNAAHAIGEKNGEGVLRKGRIRIKTRHDAPYAEVRISDDGTGIPESIRSRVYDPFFTTKGVGKGTGQGLAIVHSVITERHHGTISFESEMGVGTTFIIRLPVHRKLTGDV